MPVIAAIAPRADFASSNPAHLVKISCIELRNTSERGINPYSSIKIVNQEPSPAASTSTISKMVQRTSACATGIKALLANSPSHIPTAATSFLIAQKSAIIGEKQINTVNANFLSKYKMFRYTKKSTKANCTKVVPNTEPVTMFIPATSKLAQSPVARSNPAALATSFHAPWIASTNKTHK